LVGPEPDAEGEQFDTQDGQRPGHETMVGLAPEAMAGQDGGGPEGGEQVGADDDPGRTPEPLAVTGGLAAVVRLDGGDERLGLRQLAGVAEPRGGQAIQGARQFRGVESGEPVLGSLELHLTLMHRDDQLQGRNLALPCQIEQLRGAARPGRAALAEEADHDVALRRDLPIRFLEALPAVGALVTTRCSMTCGLSSRSRAMRCSAAVKSGVPSEPSADR
jgi:hypothetical protein